MISRDPNDLEQTTREHLHRAFAAYHAAHGRRLEPRVICVYRGPLEQNEAYSQGRSNAMFGSSFHNRRPSYAADFLLWDTKIGRFLSGSTPVEFHEYERVGCCLEGEGFRWGGRWKSPCDPGHCEAPISIEEARTGGEPAWPKT